MKRETIWINSIHFWRGDSKVVINYRDLAPWASKKSSIWFDLILLTNDEELKRIGGIAPFDCKSAMILEEELSLLNKQTKIKDFLKSFKNFDFQELATYITSYINIFNLTEGRAGQLAFPENRPDGWEAVWYENSAYSFKNRWDVEPVEVEDNEEEDDDLI